MFWFWLLWELLQGIVAVVAVFMALVITGVLWVVEGLVDLVRRRRQSVGS